MSIGDVAINPTDPNVVWVGTGEANNRQSSSWGDGIYKSVDGGKTWKNMGLRESHHIGRIIVDPQDTDIVYVAAVGRLWGANKERGVFKTTDGGVTWQHVLAINENTGATDLIMDPANSKVLIAAGVFAAPHRVGLQRRRTRLRHLQEHRCRPDLAQAGRRPARRATRAASVSTSIAATPNIVYAIVENREGGVFRSEDKGETWAKVNSLNPRPMYFSQIRVDPNDSQRIYVNGVNLHISDDGGKTFRDDGSMEVHLDHHAFWINPANSRHLIDGNDGGVWVSRDRSQIVGAPEQLSDRPVLQRRCRHAAAVSHLRRHAGQRVVGRAQLGARPPGHCQRALVSDAVVRRHVHRRRSARTATSSTPTARTAASSVTIARRASASRSCRRRKRASRRCGGTGRRRSSCRRTTSARSTPARNACSSPPIAGRPGPRSARISPTTSIATRCRSWASPAATSPWRATTACRRSATSPRWRSHRGAPACSMAAPTTATSRCRVTAARRGAAWRAVFPACPS